jgi:methionyl-tRNA formyltransferase
LVDQPTATGPTARSLDDPAAGGKRRLKLILMGTGPFAVPAFEALHAAGHHIPLVVTRPPREVRSRSGPPPSPVRQFAESLGIEVYDPPSINTAPALEKLQSIDADLLVVCDFGQILSSEALSQARLGGINLHGSLLPAYRGAAPVQWAVLSGDATTGVSVIHMTPRLDGGPILATSTTPIRPDETAGQLEERLAQLGVEPTLASVEMLAAWDGHSPIGEPQDPSRVSRAPRLDKNQGRIDWQWSAEKIDCHVRGMQPWPGAFTEVTVSPSRPPIRIAVKAVSVLPEHSSPTESASFRGSDTQPGSLLSDSALQIATGRGIIRIHRLQVAGKSEVSAEEFLRGHRLAVGTRFGGELS